MYTNLCFEQLGCQALGESKNCLTCSNRHILSDKEWEHLKELFPDSIVSYFEGHNEDSSYISVRMSKASTPAERDRETKLFTHHAKNLKLFCHQFCEDVALPEKGLTPTLDSTHLFSTDSDESEMMALVLLDDGHCIRVLSMPFNGSIPTLIRTLYDNNHTELSDLTIITDMNFKEVFTIRGSCYHCGPAPVCTYVEDVSKN